jgi:hypothetical protein
MIVRAAGRPAAGRFSASCDPNSCLALAPERARRDGRGHPRHAGPSLPTP